MVKWAPHDILHNVMSMSLNARQTWDSAA